MRRLLLLLALMAGARAAARPLHVFLAGDSTCATKNLAKQNPERGWGHMFQPLFDTWVAIDNRAANGRSTKSFRDEGRWQRILDDMRPGDYVMIQFGHNDAKQSDSTRYASPDAYEENLRRFVGEVRAREGVPVLLTPVMRRHFVGGLLTDTHGAYPDRARRVARDEGVVLLDLHAKTFAWLEGLGDEASVPFFMHVAPGVCPLYPDGRVDDTHLNVRGARIVARMVADEVEANIPELGSRLVRHDLVVARDGSGDFFTLGEAVAAIPDFGRDTTRILLCGGTYREKVVIPATKRLVALEGRAGARIVWDDYASKAGRTGRGLGTSGSATIYFGGDGWTVRDVTFANDAGRVGQAVAALCMADGLHFIRCRFEGDQDTLYLYGEGNRDGQRVGEACRMLFDGCTIEGTTDFIFGSAAALFRGCEIRAKADSYLTAASTCRGQQWGLIFVQCRLTAAEGVTKCYLGRPWRDYARTLFVDCHMQGHIRPEGWHDWGRRRARKTACYAEAGSEGPGAEGAARADWARKISRKKAYREVEAFEKAWNRR